MKKIPRAAYNKFLIKWAQKNINKGIKTLEDAEDYMSSGSGAEVCETWLNFYESFIEKFVEAI